MGKSLVTESCCGTYATLRRTRDNGCPSSRTRPWVDGTSPNAAFTSVDLPAPFGPTTAANAAEGMSTVTPESTFRPP